MSSLQCNYPLLVDDLDPIEFPEAYTVLTTPDADDYDYDEDDEDDYDEDDYDDWDEEDDYEDEDEFEEEDTIAATL